LGGTVHGKGIIVGSGNLVIAPAGAISPGLADLGTLTVNSALSLNGNLVINVQPASSDLLNIGGNLTLGGALVLSGAFGATDLEIARYSGTLTGTFSSITGLSPDFSVDYGARTNGSIRLVHTVLPTLIWDGTPGNTWSTGGGNWQGAGIFSNGSKVQFDDTATGSTAITVSGGDVSPNLITVNNAMKLYSITSAPGAAIVGGAQLIKNGAGTLTLTGPASFGGGIALNAGELRIGAPESLPNSGTITVSLNAKLETQGNNETVGELIVDGQVSGGGTMTVAGLTLGNGVTFTPNLVLNGNLTKNGTNGTNLAGSVNLGGAMRTASVTAGTAPELTLSGVVSNGGLSKAGPGTLVLNNPNNSFADGLSVLAGLVRALVAGALPANNNVTVAAAGGVEANGFNSILRLLDVSGTFQTGGGNLTVTGIAGANTGALSLGGGSLTINAQGNNNYAGAINDASSLKKNGTGTQGLTGVNAITGDIQLNAGILGIGGLSAAGSGAINVAAGATLDLGADISNVVNLNGGTVGNTGGRNYQGTLNVTADSFITNSDPDAPNTGADLVILGNGLQGTGNLTVRGITGIGGVDGSSGVRARSTFPSTYSGTVTVLNSTKFELQMPEGGTNPIGTGKVRLTGGTITGGLNGTYAQFNIRTAAGDPVFGTDVEVIGTGLANINPVNTGSVTTDQRLTLGNLKIGSGQTLGVNKNGTPTHTVIFTTVTLTGGNATFAPNTLNMGYSGVADLVLGPITESAPGSGIVMDGQATLFLSGANTYTGPTVLQRGTTRAAAAGALPATTALTMTGGILDLHDNAGASFDQTVRSLSGAAGEITNTDTVPRTLTIDQSTSTVFSGTMSGALGIVKRGTGSLTFAGFNTLSGPSRVEAGTLVVNGSHPSATTVANGGTLSGLGSVGNLLAQNGGRIAPGDGATGSLSTGSLTLDGATLALELFGTSAGSGYDQVRASGAVSLTNNPALTLTLGFDPADKIDIFIIILNSDTGSVNGTFANLPNGATFLAGTQEFQISYADDAATVAFELTGGNDVSLLAVPEPTSGLLLLTGIAAVLRRRSSRVTR
jgi:autotransporter-associated beta strand protein